jgi:hypothetical protein
MAAKKRNKAAAGRPTPDVRESAMIEAGYRCAVPACRQTISVDVHHIVLKKDGGSDKIENLIALYPTCPAALHRGTYSWPPSKCGRQRWSSSTTKLLARVLEAP